MSLTKQVVIIGASGQVGFRLLEAVQSQTASTTPASRVWASCTQIDSETKLPNSPLAKGVLKLLGPTNSPVAWFALDLQALANQEAHAIQSLQAVLQNLDLSKPIEIYMAGSFTNVDGCELEPERAWAVNFEGPKCLLLQVADYCKGRAEPTNIKFCIFSTDYVFDGLAGPYLESDATHPLSVYGRTKERLELFCKEFAEHSAHRCLIIRTNGVFDFIEGSKNFVMGVARGIQQRQELRIPCDQLGNPVWAKELARTAITLTECFQSFFEITHVAGAEFFLRHELAQCVAQLLGESGNGIVPVTTEKLKQKAVRPLRGGLKLDKLNTLTKSPPRSAREVIAENIIDLRKLTCMNI